MKKLMMLSAVAALMLGSGAYAAGPDDPTVQIKAGAAYKLAPGEFTEYASGYALSNGDQIKFTQSGQQRFWASIKGGDRVELYAVAPRVFMTSAGTRIEFREDGDSLVIDNYEKLPLPVAMRNVHVRMIAAR